MAVTADVLADGYEPDEIGLRQLVDYEICHLINLTVAFELSARNLDRPNADKYGTHPDGTPRYAPEWYVAQSIRTGLHEDLDPVLYNLLSCDDDDGNGHRCIGALGHNGPWHHDGNGENWP